MAEHHFARQAADIVVRLDHLRLAGFAASDGLFNFNGVHTAALAITPQASLEAGSGTFPGIDDLHACSFIR